VITRLPVLVGTLAMLGASAFANTDYRKSTAPRALLVRTSTLEAEIIYPGFVTVPSGPGGFQAFGVGLTSAGTAAVASVKAVAVVRSSTSLVLTGLNNQQIPTEVFQFTPNTALADEFKKLKTAEWTAFHAQTTTIPFNAHVPVAYRVTLELKTNVTDAQLLTAATEATIGCDEATAGDKLSNTFRYISTPSAVASPDLLYYKFTTSGAPDVLNFADTAVAAGLGTLTTNDGNPYTTGKFGFGLKGATDPSKLTVVDTPWRLRVGQGFTVAWYMKQRYDHQKSLSYIFAGPSSLRVFTGGVVGNFLMCRGWGGRDLPLLLDVRTMAKDWVHVALAVDPNANTATWYVDGKESVKITTSDPVSFGGAGTFRIGGRDNTSPSHYDVDEFRLVTHVASATEIADWAKQANAGEALFASGCGAALSTSGGKPMVGNTNWQWVVESDAKSAAVVLIGLSRTSFGALPLPADFGPIFPGLAGCKLYIDLVHTVFASTGAGGIAQIPFPLTSAFSVLEGFNLYGQAIVITGSQEVRSSNPFGAAIELH